MEFSLILGCTASTGARITATRTYTKTTNQETSATTNRHSAGYRYIVPTYSGCRRGRGLIALQMARPYARSRGLVIPDLSAVQHSGMDAERMSSSSRRSGGDDWCDPASSPTGRSFVILGYLADVVNQHENSSHAGMTCCVCSRRAVCKCENWTLMQPLSSRVTTIRHSGLANICKSSQEDA